MQAIAQTMRLEDALNVFHARNFAYDVLRRFFIEEPSKEYLKQFSYQNMIDLFPFQEESQELQEGIQHIKNYFSSYDPVNNKDDYENLHWDYTKMFIGPFEIKVFPWESTYVTKEKFLYQETTLTVRKEYEKFAFQCADYMEADDHIGLELDFMFHLNQLCIESCSQNNKNALTEVSYLLHEQQKFINQHLGRFVQAFSDGVTQHADTEFYIGLAKILNHYLLIDLKVLEELLNIHLEK
ncbi:TorD/DmsD family molecular chaperone [Bacillus massiliigorillae]|uniref:TorD/DmsD family molecular chaperone n=1 Tax=Bacillus massiliigorillae TaxID=1243664 RepID=UPI00039C1C8D|nr:molecular chaperone TorD family protein [Bacillus massiliigorillae]